MIEKTYSLLGLRKTTTLYLFRRNGKVAVETIMRELTPEQEAQCEDKNLSFVHINDKLSIDKRHIILYGDVNLKKEEDVESIINYCYIPEDYDAHVHSNFNYEDGTFTTIEGIAKSYTTFDSLLWFKYNHCLIGKPKKILIYKKYGNC